MVTLFLSPSCTSCRKARAWLTNHEVAFDEHNIITSPLTHDELMKLDGFYAELYNSQFSEEAEYRRENKSWMRYSQRIAMAILDKMEQSHLTQKALAERMGCSQQYVSKILKGRENLSIETLAKIENALSMQLLSTKIVRTE